MIVAMTLEIAVYGSPLYAGPIAVIRKLVGKFLAVAVW